MNVTNNTILITGGGSGIGLALAKAFHALDNQVIVSGRRQQNLDEAVRANPGITAIAADVTDRQSIATLAERLEHDYPKLNAVFNVAGISKAEDLSRANGDVATADEIVATNLIGTIAVNAVLLPLLLRQERATIMNVSSGLAFVPLALTPTYCATKAAIHSYTQSLRYQLKETAVEVLELIPPYVQTSLGGAHQENDPAAMPLQEYIAETMEILTTQPDTKEIIVKRCDPLRYAAEEGLDSYDRMFAGFNDSMSAAMAH